MSEEQLQKKCRNPDYNLKNQNQTHNGTDKWRKNWKKVKKWVDIGGTKAAYARRRTKQHNFDKLTGPLIVQTKEINFDEIQKRLEESKNGKAICFGNTKWWNTDQTYNDEDSTTLW